MKRASYILLTLLLFIGVGFYFYNSEKELATYQSPDGKYELVIQRKRLGLFIPTMPGDGSSFCVEVVLKSADGKIIGTSNSNNNCAIFKDSIEVDWDIENNEVWYGRGKTIHLITGKVAC